MIGLVQRLLLYQLVIIAIPASISIPLNASTKEEVVIYPGEAYIQTANYTGTGCPLNSASFIFHQGANQFSVNFKHFTVNNHSKYDSSYCELTFTIVAPPGVAYRLHYLEYQGHTELDQDGSATISNDSRLQGKVIANKSTRYLYGSLDGMGSQYFQRSVLKNHYQTWSTCSWRTPLEVTTKLSLSSGDLRSAVTIDNLSGKISFSRKPCKKLKLNLSTRSG